MDPIQKQELLRKALFLEYMLTILGTKPANARTYTAKPYVVERMLAHEYGIASVIERMQKAVSWDVIRFESQHQLETLLDKSDEISKKYIDECGLAYTVPESAYFLFLNWQRVDESIKTHESDIRYNKLAAKLYYEFFLEYQWDNLLLFVRSYSKPH